MLNRVKSISNFSGEELVAKLRDAERDSSGEANSLLGTLQKNRLKRTAEVAGVMREIIEEMRGRRESDMTIVRKLLYDRYNKSYEPKMSYGTLVDHARLIEIETGVRYTAVRK